MGLSVGWLLVKHTQNAKNKPVINSADAESRKTLSQELTENSLAGVTDTRLTEGYLVPTFPAI